MCPLWLIRQVRRLPIITTLLPKICQDCIPHRPIRMFVSGMNDETCWLVHNQQVMVLIDHRYLCFHSKSIGVSELAVNSFMAIGNFGNEQMSEVSSMKRKSVEDNSV